MALQALVSISFRIPVEQLHGEAVDVAQFFHQFKAQYFLTLP